MTTQPTHRVAHSCGSIAWVGYRAKLDRLISDFAIEITPGMSPNTFIFASEIGPGFSPDIPGKTNKRGFNLRDTPSFAEPK